MLYRAAFKDMIYKDAVKAMQAIVDRGSGDPEMDHGDADDLLCEFLKSLGYGHLVEIYEKVEKWYA